MTPQRATIGFALQNRREIINDAKKTQQHIRIAGAVKAKKGSLAIKPFIIACTEAVASFKLNFISLTFSPP